MSEVCGLREPPPQRTSETSERSNAELEALLAEAQRSMAELRAQRDASEAECTVHRDQLERETARRQVHDEQVLPHLTHEQLGDEAGKMVLECGWLGSTGSLPEPRRDATIAKSIGQLLVGARMNGGTEPTAPAQPEVVRKIQAKLCVLMKSGLINTCDPDAISAMLKSHAPLAIVEDWKPWGCDDITPETVHLLRSAETRSPAYLGDPHLHLQSYWVHREGGEPRMSCTGMSAQTSACEVTGEAQIACALFDLLTGYFVHDRALHPHLKVPEYQKLIRAHFGPILFPAILGNPNYFFVNIRSSIVRECAIEWMQQQGIKAFCAHRQHVEEVGGPLDGGGQ